MGICRWPDLRQRRFSNGIRSFEISLLISESEYAAEERFDVLHAVAVEATSCRHRVQDRLHVTSPHLSSPEISAEGFDFPPQHLITTVRRGAGALFDSRKVNGLHKRGECNRSFWCQGGCIDFREECLGSRACLFLGHVSHSAQLLTQSFALKLSIHDTVIRIADVPHAALRIDGTPLFSPTLHSFVPSFCHLAFAAIRAISLSSPAVSFCFRALAPLRPMAESAEDD